MAKDDKGGRGGKGGRKPDPSRKRRINRDLVLRALTDRKFRKQLTENPAEVLGKRPSDVNAREIQLVLAAVKGIESQIRGLADELLCANGPCGIAVG